MFSRLPSDHQNKRSWHKLKFVLLEQVYFNNCILSHRSYYHPRKPPVEVKPWNVLRASSSISEILFAIILILNAPAQTNQPGGERLPYRTIENFWKCSASSYTRRKMAALCYDIWDRYCKTGHFFLCTESSLQDIVKDKNFGTACYKAVFVKPLSI